MYPNIFYSEMLSWVIEIWMKSHLVSVLLQGMTNTTEQDKIELVALNTIFSVLCVCLY